MLDVVLPLVVGVRGTILAFPCAFKKRCVLRGVFSKPASPCVFKRGVLPCQNLPIFKSLSGDFNQEALSKQTPQANEQVLLLFS